jgi:hypothetical protein
MSYRPFRSIGRYLLAACAVSLGAASLSAQTAPSTAVNPSRVDIFAGYSYFGAHGQIKPAGYNYSSVDEGAVGSVAYYFNKYVGAEVETFINPNGRNDGLYSGSAGPIFRAPMQNYTLFAHALAGGVRLGGPNTPGSGYENPYTWGTGLTVGGGMDYDLPFFNHRFGLRLFEADYRYIHVDFGPNAANGSNAPLGGRANLDAAELSSGLLFHVGHIIPPPPVTYACVLTSPTGTIYPGDVVTVTGTPTNILPKKDVTYTWTSDAGPVSGTSNVGTVSSTTPGTYKVVGHVSQGSKPGQFADCAPVAFTVAAFEPPTVGCSANPSTVNSGDPSIITAAGVSAQNRPLTYSYSSTAGTINGNTGSATLATTGVAPGTTISVTCNVVDDKGQTASQMTTVTVNAAAAAPAPSTQALCTISFDKDHRRPTRVDNEAKACLDDIALSAQRDSTAKLAIVGNSEPVKVMGHKTPRKEEFASKETMKLAAERAVNEKAYLVTDKGLDASRISVYTGTAGTNTSATTIIPAGATLDSTGFTPVDETMVKAVPRKALGEKKHHHKK